MEVVVANCFSHLSSWQKEAHIHAKRKHSSSELIETAQEMSDEGENKKKYKLQKF